MDGLDMSIHEVRNFVRISVGESLNKQLLGRLSRRWRTMVTVFYENRLYVNRSEAVQGHY
jgi:hypothetical protein